MAGPWEEYAAQPAQEPETSQQDAPAESGPWEDFAAAQAKAPDAAPEKGPWDDFAEKPKLESSALGAGARAFANSAITTAASLPAVGAGAALGAAGGAAVGGPAGGLVGGFAGAVAGGIGGGYVVDKMKDFLLDKMGLREGEGLLSRAQEQADREQHPNMTFGGDLAGALPSFAARGPATLAQRVLSGGAQGGIEAGSELYDKGTVDIGHVAASALVGGVLANPRGFANKALNAGENLGNKVAEGMRIPGRPDQSGPLSQPAKEAADLKNDQPITTQGATTVQPPPPAVDALSGNPQSAPARSERTYPKADDTGKQGTNVSENLIPVEQQEALMASMQKGAVRNTNEMELRGFANPENQGPPYPTGIVEAAEAQKGGAVGEAPPQKLKTDTEIRNKPPEPAADEMIQPKTEAEFGESANADMPIEQQISKAATEVVDEAIKRNMIKPEDREHFLAEAQRTLTEEHAKNTSPAAAAEVPFTPPAPPKTARDRAIDTSKRRSIPREELAAADKTKAAVPHGLEPAIRDAERGEVWTGKNHADAAEQAGFPHKLEEGYWHAASKRYLSREEAARFAEKPVTATVTEPKAKANEIERKPVRLAVEQLRKAGMNAEADALLKMPVGEQIKAANRAMNTLTAKTARVSNDTARLRNAEVKKNLEIPGSNGMTARTIAERDRKGKEIADRTEVYDSAKQGDVKERVSAALEAAKGLMTYKPRTPDRAYSWLREARDLAKRNFSPAALEKFQANEALIRGTDEQYKSYTDNRRDEAAQNMSRRSGDEAVNSAEKELHSNPRDVEDALIEEIDAKRAKPGEFPSQDKEIKTAADLRAEPANKDFDLSKLTPEQEGEITKQQKTVVDNIVRDLTAAEKRKAEAKELAGRKSKPVTDTEKVTVLDKNGKPIEIERSKAAGEVRRIAIDDTTRKYAEDIAKKASEKPKTYEERIEKRPDEIEKTDLESMADRFLRMVGDERGSVDLDKIAKYFGERTKTISKGMEKYFGVPMTDIAKNADKVLAMAMAERSKMTAEMVKHTDDRWYWFMKHASREEGLTYLKELENSHTRSDYDKLMRQGATHDAALKQVKDDFQAALEAGGIKPDKAKVMAEEMLFHRDMMDKIFVDDALRGSTAEYRESYIPHLFDKTQINGMKAHEFIEAKIKTLGQNWYQKTRMFDLMADAIKAGYKPRYENPIDFLTARWMASIHSNLLVDTAGRLKTLGYAVDTKSATPSQKEMMQGGLKIRLPDHSEWMIHPDAMTLFKNAFDNAGLMMRSDMLGSMYRGWMKIKTVWMPLQLAISGFHLLHVVANINPVQNLTRAIKLSQEKGDWVKNLADAGKLSLSQPIFNWPLDKIGMGFGKAIDNLSGNRFSNALGRQIAEDWHRTPAELAKLPMERQINVQLFKEAGVAPHQPKQDIIGAKREWAKAWNDKSLAMIPAGVRRVIEKMQEPLFRHLIPQLKNEQLIRGAAAMMEANPSLVHDFEARQRALRQLGKSIDDRFGEMFYDSLFWNKTLKEVGIGSMVSLSWNLGQVRQAGGAIHELAGRGGLYGKQTRLTREKNQMSDKGTFVLAYAGASMLSAGMIAAAMTGTLPDTTDLFFPRNGLTNPDGTPGRLTTPFNTREIPMAIGHVQEKNSLLGGLANLIWNKTILQPIVEARANKDYWGHELYDTNAPAWKRVLQLVDSTIGGHVNPISLSGAQRAKELGGGAGQQALAYAGFGPAPKYIANDKLQNRITALFNEHVTPESKPYQYGEKTGLGRGLVQGAIRATVGDKLKQEVRQEARGELNRAQQAGEGEKAAEARLRLIKEGKMSTQTVKNLDPKMEFDYKFSRLPSEDQMSLVKEMDENTYRRYVLRNRMSNNMKAPLIKWWRANHTNP